MTTIIALVHSDPFMGLEFMIQLKNEHKVYRVVNINGDIASIFCGDREIFNCCSLNVKKTLITYLRRRFYDWEIMDFSNEFCEEEKMNERLQ